MDTEVRVRWWPILALLLGGLWVFSACAPQIGDPCQSNIECPEGGTCDTSALAGYCLSFSCTPNGCSEEAVCINFPTFSACMKHCKVDEDCRVEDGYVCRTDNGPIGFCYHAAEEP